MQCGLLVFFSQVMRKMCRCPQIFNVNHTINIHRVICFHFTTTLSYLLENNEKANMSPLPSFPPEIGSSSAFSPWFLYPSFDDTSCTAN